ncbi:MAG: thermonuclease family protein, partial [Candidatus Bipolaricaulia bacterium]
MKRLAVAVILMVLGLTRVSLGLPPFPAPPIVAEVTTVIDGDTIRVVLTTVPESLADRLPVGSEETVRYIGVQAPELAEPHGPEAASLNRLLVEGRTVYLETDELLRNSDAGGLDVRLLAYVYLDPAGLFMVNLALIATAIIGTKTYEGTARYSALFEEADSLTNADAPRTCADCLVAL